LPDFNIVFSLFYNLYRIRLHESEIS
jgi:hypothetical protein